MVFIHAAFAHIFLHVVASMRLAAGLLLFGLLTASTAYAETVTYQHDNNGNITQRITIFGTTTYTYDAQNQLISESGPAKTQSFTYDANSNRLSDGAGSYTYETGSNRMLTRRGLPVTTDAAGNITADGTGREYVSNQAGQLAQVKQNGILIATYAYDTNGLRMSKTTTASAPQGAQTVIYEYDEQGHLIAEFSGTGTPIRAYIWLVDTPLSQIEYVPSRKIYYFNVDHLNTPRSMMDDTGKVVWRWESDAFGSTLPDEDPDRDGNKFTTNLRFPGQYYDQETGLHYNWHRYYDPTTGRYIQSDPRGLEGGINTYAYANQNPLAYIDPTGEFGLTLRGAIAAIGAVYGGYKTWDKYDALQQCKKDCKMQCENISACGDPERGDTYKNNEPRCINSCIPLCTAGYVVPKKGPTGPQPPSKTPDYVK